MDLRQLRYFVAVAEELHFERAARRVGIEQSPLSQQIRKLEGGLGVQLLTRTTRGSKLTSAGEALLTDAKRVLDLVDGMRRRARDTAAGKLGRIRIGVTDDAASSSFSKLLASYKERSPGIEIHVTEIIESEQLEDLTAGRIDVVFLTCRPIAHSLTVFDMRREHIGVLLPRSHPLAMKDAIRAVDLADPKLILLSTSGSGCDLQMRTLLEGTNLRPTAQDHSLHRATVLRLVSAGLGLAFAPVRPELQTQCAGTEVTLKLIDDPRAVLMTYGAFRTDEECKATLDLINHAQLRDWIDSSPLKN